MWWSTRPLEGEDQVRFVAVAGRVEDLQPVQVDVRRDARDEVAVLLGGEDAGDVRPVAVVVHRVGVVVHEVVAALVVVQELGVDDVRDVVRVVVDVVDAGVDDRDLDAVAPDAGGVDGRRADPLHAPGVVVLEVERLQRDIGLDGLDAGLPGELLELALRDAGGETVDEGELLVDLAAVLLDHPLRRLSGRPVERDDDLGPLDDGVARGRDGRRRKESEDERGEDGNKDEDGTAPACRSRHGPISLQSRP